MIRVAFLRTRVSGVPTTLLCATEPAAMELGSSMTITHPVCGRLYITISSVTRRGGRRLKREVSSPKIQRASGSEGIPI
jgi:hypothetical protein